MQKIQCCNAYCCNTVKITKKTKGSLWNYYRDQPSNRLSTYSKSFNYKTSITGNTYNVDEKITDDDGNEVDNPNYDANKVGKNKTEIVIPLKHLSNFREVQIYHWIRILNNRHKIVCSSCYFVKRK